MDYFVFETQDPAFAKLHALKIADKKTTWKSEVKLKHFKSINDVKLNELVDAMDSKGKWYKGFIVEEKEDRKGEILKKVHFFNFDPKWDEWYSNENIDKIAPYLTYCQESEEIYF